MKIFHKIIIIIYIIDFMKIIHKIDNKRKKLLQNFHNLVKKKKITNYCAGRHFSRSST